MLEGESEAVGVETADTERLGMLELPAELLTCIMAKPMAGTTSACSSQNSLHPAEQSLHQSSYLRPRRRPPSATLLSILATIAASSSAVDGHPVSPPSFLCPSIDCESRSRPVTPRTIAPESGPGPSISLTPAPTPTQTWTRHRPRSRSRRRPVPEQYSAGVDGRWRRVDEYTLYGSTLCLVRIIKTLFAVRFS